MSGERMSVEAALRHLDSRRDPRGIVITNMASARLWPRLSTHALDFNYNPSTMSGVIPLALGVALSKPDRDVIVISGDGSLLMSLGSLVTVAAMRPPRLSVLLLDNQVYEVTGGQPTAAVDANTDFAAIAKGCGIPSVANFNTLEQWSGQSEAFFALPGPRFASLAVGPTPTEAMETTFTPVDQRIRQFQDALRS